jgi:hypothetical protein
VKIVYVAVILLLQGRAKEIRYITVHGRYWLEVNFSNAKIYLNTENSKNSICWCYTFATGSFKRNPIHYGQWTIFIENHSFDKRDDGVKNKLVPRVHAPHRDSWRIFRCLWHYHHTARPVFPNRWSADQRWSVRASGVVRGRIRWLLIKK